MDLAIWHPDRDGDRAGDAVANLVLAAGAASGPRSPAAAVVPDPPAAAVGSSRFFSRATICTSLTRSSIPMSFSAMTPASAVNKLRAR